MHITNTQTAQEFLLNNGYDPSYLKVAPNPYYFISAYKKEKYVEVLKAILTIMPEWIHLTDSTEGNLVHLALEHSTTDLLVFLVENGASTTIKDNYGLVPLQKAISNKKNHALYLLEQHKGQILKEYYEQGIFKNATHHIRQLLLEWGYIPTDEDTMKVFSQVFSRLRAFKSLNESYHADDYTEIDNVDWLYPITLENFEYYLKKGANPNAKSIQDFLLPGTPILFIATYFGIESIVKLLLQYGADTEASFPANGWTSWKYAKQTGAIKITKLLEQAGAKQYDLSNQAFIQAAIDNDIPTIKKWLAKGIDIDLKDKHARTALYQAIDQKHYDCANVLLDEGANANQFFPFKAYSSILKLLIRQYSTPPQQALIQRLLQLDLSDKAYQDTFYFLVKNKQYDFANRIYHLNPTAATSVFKDLLSNACDQEDLELLAYLLEKGANPNEPFPYNTPLLIAIQRGHLTIVKRLLAAGADPNLSDSTGNFPLIKATQGYKNKGERIPIIVTLIQHGANIWKQHYIYSNILEAAKTNKPLLNAIKFMATWGKTTEPDTIIESLTIDDFNLWIEVASISAIDKVLKKGFPINNVQTHQMSPLVKAAKCNRKDIFLTLLHRGANVALPYKNKNQDFRDRNCTALGAAAQLDSTTVKTTIRYGADINQIFQHTDYYNGTPLSTAADLKAYSSVKVLLEAGANPNFLKYGYSPLYEAVKNKDLKLVQLLIQYGANPNFKGFFKIETPLMLAEKRGYTEIIKALKTKKHDT